MKPNYCSNCGFLMDNPKNLDKCPTCGTDKRNFATYDTRLEEYVKSSVKGNLTYPDPQGTDWAHPNSSLTRHVRAAVFNAIVRTSNGRR